MSKRRHLGEFRWEGVALQPYKEPPEMSRRATRQVLFDGEYGSAAQLRYFEIEAGGHTTLERHEHPHAVIVLRGRGHVLVDGTIEPVAPLDLVSVPPMTWHQLRAAEDATLGFLCMVDMERDRPQRPDEDELRDLRADPVIARFLDGH